MISESMDIIKEIAKKNQKHKDKLFNIMDSLNDIKTGAINTYDDNDNLFCYYSKENLKMTQKLLQDQLYNSLYYMVYIRLEKEGFFNDFETKRCYEDAADIVHDCACELIDKMNLWTYCDEDMLKDVGIL